VTATPSTSSEGGSRIALAGATGFIGRRIALRLLESGRQPRALVRPGSKRTGRIPEGCVVCEAPLRRDDPALLRALEGVDAAIYAAGTVRGREAADFRAGNVDGVAAFAAALGRAAPSSPMLLLSSLAAARPEVSPYAASKRQGEGQLEGLAAPPWTILRPPAVYGPGDREMRPLLAMMRRGLVFEPGPPGQRLSLIHVDDLASAVLRWLASPPIPGQCFEVDDGKPGGYAFMEIARAARPSGRLFRLQVPRLVLGAAASVNLACAKALGYAPMLTPGKVRELAQRSWVCDSSPYRQATGWRPAIPLEEGVRRLFG